MKFDRAVEYNINRTLNELYKYEVPGMELILQEISDLRESRIYEKMYEGSIRAEKFFLQMLCKLQMKKIRATTFYPKEFKL